MQKSPTILFSQKPSKVCTLSLRVLSTIHDTKCCGPTSHFQVNIEIAPFTPRLTLLSSHVVYLTIAGAVGVFLDVFTSFQLWLYLHFVVTICIIFTIFVFSWVDQFCCHATINCCILQELLCSFLPLSSFELCQKISLSLLSLSSTSSKNPYTCKQNDEQETNKQIKTSTKTSKALNGSLEKWYLVVLSN